MSGFQDNAPKNDRHFCQGHAYPTAEDFEHISAEVGNLYRIMTAHEDLLVSNTRAVSALHRTSNHHADGLIVLECSATSSREAVIDLHDHVKVLETTLGRLVRLEISATNPDTLIQTIQALEAAVSEIRDLVSCISQECYARSLETLEEAAVELKQRVQLLEETVEEQMELSGRTVDARDEEVMNIVESETGQSKGVEANIPPSGKDIDHEGDFERGSIQEIEGFGWTSDEAEEILQGEKDIIDREINLEGREIILTSSKFAALKAENKELKVKVKLLEEDLDREAELAARVETARAMEICTWTDCLNRKRESES